MRDNQLRLLLVEQRGGMISIASQDVVGKSAPGIVFLGAIHMQRPAEEANFGAAELRHRRTGLINQVEFIYPTTLGAGQQGAAQPLVIFVVPVNDVQRHGKAESLFPGLGQEIFIEAEIAHLDRGGNPKIRLRLPQTRSQFPVLAMDIADNQDTHNSSGAGEVRLQS